MTYPVNFRKRVLKIKEKEQLSYAEIAKRFGMSKTTIFGWSKKIEPQKGRNKKPSKINMEALKKDIEKYPDSYCYERAQRLGASSSGIRAAKHRLGVTYKKNPKTSKGRSRKKIYVLPRNSKATK